MDVTDGTMSAESPQPGDVERPVVAIEGAQTTDNGADAGNLVPLLPQLRSMTAVVDSAVRQQIFRVADAERLRTQLNARDLKTAPLSFNHKVEV